MKFEKDMLMDVHFRTMLVSNFSDPWIDERLLNRQIKNLYVPIKIAQVNALPTRPLRQLWHTTYKLVHRINSCLSSLSQVPSHESALQANRGWYKKDERHHNYTFTPSTNTFIHTTTWGSQG